MSRIINRISDVSGVTQGGTAIIKPLVGPRYFSINVWVYVNGVLTAVTDVVDRVRVSVNSKEIWNVSAARLLKRWRVDNAAPATGRLPLSFAMAARADKQDEVFTCFDTFGEDDFTIELGLKELADPADVIRLRAVASYDNGMFVSAAGKRLKQHIKLQEVSDALISGASDITKIPVQNPIQRIFLDTASTISLLEVDADGTRHHEALVGENNAILADYGLDGTQFAYTYGPDHSEQVLDHLRVAKTLNLRPTSSAANPVTCLVESLSPEFLK